MGRCWLIMRSGRGLRGRLRSLRLLWRSYRQRRALRRLPEIDKIVRQLQREEALEIKGPVDFVEKVLGILVSCGSSRARL